MSTNPPVRGERVLTEAQLDTKFEQLMRKQDWNKLIYVLRDMNASLSFAIEDDVLTADVLANKNRTFTHWQLAVHTADQQLVKYVMTEAVTFPALFAGAQVAIGVSAAAETTLSIEKNGTEVGTIVIATDDGVTYTSTASAAVAFAVGDVLTIEGQLVADTLLADVSISLMGAVA